MEMTPEQVQRYREMTPADKARLIQRLWDSAWQLKEAGLRLRHPDWDSAAIRREVRKIFLYARE